MSDAIADAAATLFAHAEAIRIRDLVSIPGHTKGEIEKHREHVATIINAVLSMDRDAVIDATLTASRDVLREALAHLADAIICTDRGADA